jgi:hypothetical protein
MKDHTSFNDAADDSIVNSSDITSMYPHVVGEPIQLKPFVHKPPSKFMAFMYAHPKIHNGLMTVLETCWPPIGRVLFWLLGPIWLILAKTYYKKDAAFILQHIYWLFERPWKW